MSTGVFRKPSRIEYWKKRKLIPSKTPAGGGATGDETRWKLHLGSGRILQDGLGRSIAIVQ